MLRPLRLAQVAAEAEVVRLKQMAARTAVRAALGIVALVFFVAVLVDLHVIIAIWLLPHFGALIATLIVLGVDAVFLILFGALAYAKPPGKAERDALQVRETARQQLVQAAAAASVIAPISRMMGNRSMFKVVMAALMARMFTASAKRS